MFEKKSTTIPLDKKKTIINLFGALLFVVLGLAFIIAPQKFFDFSLIVRIFAFIVGLISIIFFGFILIVGLQNLFENKSGLTINEDGVIDDFSGYSIGLISWNDILEIKTIKVSSQKFLILIVKNPQDYINKQTNKIKRKFLEINYKKYDSPITFSANSLLTSFNEMEKIIMDKYLTLKK